MGYNVICISGHDGALAAVVARYVAESLGFRLVDEEIVANAALEAGLDDRVIADVERRRSLLSRLLEDVSAGSASVDPLENALYGGTGREELRALIRWAIEETADEGAVVLVAHAASFALASRDHVLRVLVTASPSTRRRRLASELQVDDGEAGRVMKRSDAGRADYIKRFYGVEEELPTHYDLVVNTDKLAAGDASRVIARAASGE
jgi:cytidylate kinase